ncbi:hypothetical protein, partial [Streptomyces sp. NPDC004763]
MILSEDISPSPSVVRICPFRGETTWSFLTRLAEAHRLKPALLLKSLGVEHSAVPRTGQTREVSLSAGARQFRLDQSVVGSGVPLTDAQWARIEPLLPDR